MPAPHVWVAEPHEAETVARLIVAFRDHLGRDWPSDNAFLAGIEGQIEQPDTEFLLGAAHADAPPAGVAQLRYRHGLWRAGPDCHLEDLFVAQGARGAGLGRALVDAAVSAPASAAAGASSSTSTRPTPAGWRSTARPASTCPRRASATSG